MTLLHFDLDSFTRAFDTQTVNASRVTINLPRPPRRFYRHGWQSWSLAAWTDLTPLPMQKPDILLSLQVDPKYAHEPNPHGSWLGAVDFEDGEVLLLGAVGTDAHVRLNGNRFEGWYEADAGEWFIGFGERDVVFSNYAEKLREKFGASKKKSAPRVWCSWYSLYSAISESRLTKAFEELSDLPFDFFQIDDGWQKAVGDWEVNKKFPKGIITLAERIKSTGHKSGLWLAPLIAVKSSQLFREHADWFLRDENGKYVSAGFNWGEQLYALDTTHPAVLEWLAVLMKKARAWGYDYLKLDFLYAGALPGKRHLDMPREAAYREGLKVMREAMGVDAFFLACGAPIIPSLGLCDAMRIGPDVAGEWESYRDVILLQNPTTPGTKNAICTTLNRLWLSPLVHIDPDVAYFNSKNNSLTPEQKRLLQDLALICNYKAASDWPGWLSADEKKALHNFLEANPVITQNGQYIFEIDGRVVDFGPAISLPIPPAGWDAISRRFISWLGNQGWALKLNNEMDKRSLEKYLKGMNASGKNSHHNTNNKEASS